MEWGLAALVAIMVGIGLLAMYAMEFAYSDLNVYNGFQFFLKKAVFTAIGIMFIIGIYFWTIENGKSIRGTFIAVRFF